LTAGYAHEGSNGILIWDLATRQLKPVVLPSSTTVSQVVFSADGRYLAAACGDAGTVLYDVPSFQRRLFVSGFNPLGVAFSPDGQTLAIPSIQFGVVRLWNTTANREVAVLRHPGDPRWVAFRSDGRSLVTAHPRSVRIWNLAGRGEKRVLPGHEGGVAGIAFSPDGKMLASVGKDRTATVWDPSDGRIIHSLTGFRGVLHAVAFSPHGRLLAIGDRAGQIRIWEVSTWQELPVPSHSIGDMIWSLAFSPDGRYFAACGLPGGLALWHMKFQPSSAGRKAQLKLDHIAHFAEAGVHFVCFSPHSTLMVRCADSTARAWDLTTSRPLSPLPARLLGPLNSLAFRPGGTQVALIGQSFAPEVWDAVTGEQVFALPGGDPNGARTAPIAGMIALSADGAWLAQHGTAVKVWDLDTRKLLLVLPEEQSTPWCMAWSPDKSLLAVGSEHGSITLWDLPRMRSQLANIGLDW
jgi:WD40 repeat protein